MRIRFRQRPDVLDLPLRQLIVALVQLAVGALAGVAGDHIDCAVPVAAGHILCGDRGRLRVAEGIFQRPVDPGKALFLQHGLELRHILRAVIRAGLIKAVEPGLCGDGKARLFQSLLDVDHTPDVDVAGAGAALDHAAHAVSEHGQCSAVGVQGQDAAVLQKDHSLRGDPPYSFHIARFPLRHLRACGGKKSGHIVSSSIVIDFLGRRRRPAGSWPLVFLIIPEGRRRILQGMCQFCQLCFLSPLAATYAKDGMARKPCRLFAAVCRVRSCAVYPVRAHISGEISLASCPTAFTDSFSFLMLSAVTGRHLASVSRKSFSISGMQSALYR